MKRRTRGKGEGTNEVDVLVGQRLRELRMLAGLSQSDLASTIGLTFQQLQKYERGVNRISASKIYLLARHLNVPISALFADMDGSKAGGSAEDLAGVAPAESNAGDAQLRSREALVLARNYLRIKDPDARAALKAFVEACASDATAEAGTGAERTVLEGSASESGQEGEGRRSRRPRGVAWHPSDIALS